MRGRPPVPDDEKHIRATFTLPPKLVKALEEEAKKSGESKSQIVAKALVTLLNVNQEGMVER